MSSALIANPFRQLANSAELLVLANIWDAGSARLAESLGTTAVATTSAGLAWANGYADGAFLPVDVHTRALARICRSVNCPVTADIENGYSDSPVHVAEIAMRLVSPGVQGINIEDGDGTSDLLCQKIEAVKNRMASQGLDLFVNARTDVYLRRLSGDPAAETLRRASKYHNAGADGLFVPGLIDASDIKLITDAAKLPLNVMALPGLPSLERLLGLGVRRLTAGPALLQRLWSSMAELIEEFNQQGGTPSLFDHAASYDAVQSHFAE
ncbi:isocitrate lyase/PEP mutase family protein [Pseudomarimonas salicorniae]|uniref:Isocitrate lyase/phosphoenolpyruvate mutase family protein n=1 Tax=Pseudomarimonas salicorniae TaxID=2933270 RepID=A0ABT0GG27_9GAMM|nr:isocitrate lyase/phosphoenolpyruvate mutase family protein [Lysobacter sp. CAU 1642]MCK7593495.1 isocitrate lyase/phosphoenolpyruvate mutase family protein [Lysobacter sp. CAU 1642]